MRCTIYDHNTYVMIIREKVKKHSETLLSKLGEKLNPDGSMSIITPREHIIVCSILFKHLQDTLQRILCHCYNNQLFVLKVLEAQYKLISELPFALTTPRQSRQHRERRSQRG